MHAPSSAYHAPIPREFFPAEQEVDEPAVDAPEVEPAEPGEQG